MRDSLTGISKWRRCCSKGTMNNQNVIRRPLKRFQSSKLWEIRWSWSEKVRCEVRWVRCGLGGFPPVVLTPFGRLGVGSNHQVEVASFSGSSGLGAGRHDIGRLNTLNGRAGREYPPGNFTLSSCEVNWRILSSSSSFKRI